MKVDRWRHDIVPVAQDCLEQYRHAGHWANLTIGERLHEIALVHEEYPALIEAERTMNFRKLDERTDRIAAGLASLGFRPGDAVMLQVGNTIGAVLAWYGLIKAGVIPVATLDAHRGHELHEIGTLCEAAGHIVQADHAKADLVDLARQMAERSGTSRVIMSIGASAAGSDVVRIEDLGADLSAAEARAVVERIAAGIEGDDIAVFQLSGGTTSTPKIIPRLHDDYWYNSAAYARRLGWDSSVRVAHILPLIHNAGIVCALHAAHSVGGAVVLTTANPAQLLPLMARSGVTDLMAFPSLAIEWREHAGFDAAVASLKRIVLSGAKVNDACFRLFEERGVRVLGLYGAGEGLVTVTPHDAPAAVRQHSIGVPLCASDDVRVYVPGTENPVPDGTVGELRFSGPYTLRGYLRSPERNREAFTSDGLYRSGDLVAWRHIDGVRTLTFEGRAKDLVNRGGEKVNAAEIEALVVQIPKVARAALIPVPDERLGERACICLEMVRGAPAPSLDDVVAWLREREVAKYKWPERLEIFESLPQTRVGKVDKRALIDRVVNTACVTAKAS